MENLSIFLSVLLTAAAFYWGYLFGAHYRPMGSPCIEHSLIDTSSVSCEPISSDCFFATNIQNTHLTRLPFDTISSSVLSTVFGMTHHPSCPSQAELTLMQRPPELNRDYTDCESVYMVRSSIRADQPPKCSAMVRISSLTSDTIFRIGETVGIKFQSAFQDDICRAPALIDEASLVPLFMSSRAGLLSKFIATLGDPVEPSGRRRVIVMMIANEGVMDLLLNFLCSARAIQFPMSDIVVFIGQEDLRPVLEAMGIHVFFDASLGDMPRQAAGNYADRVFTRIMWLKVTSVYLGLHAGFHVLFQDVDLVWMRSPIEYLEQMQRYDVIMMDDGARTPRFAPFFTNTGFYFIRRTEKTLYLLERLSRAAGEISYAASHQVTFIRYLTEAQASFGTQLLVLDDRLFPSGRMYHEQPEFVTNVKSHVEKPFVWHMCWTANRNQKVEYYKNLGLWFLSDMSEVNGTSSPKGAEDKWNGRCEIGSSLREIVAENSNAVTFDLLSHCCLVGDYWK